MKEPKRTQKGFRASSGGNNRCLWRSLKKTTAARGKAASADIKILSQQERADISVLRVSNE